MKRKAVSMILAVTMVATMAVGCGGSKTADTTAPADDAAAEETTEADAADAEDTADAAADAVDGDLADKKVGVCIYQFSDNFMTLFRTELQSYLESKGFKAENIKIVDGANDQATQSGQIDNFITEGVDVLIINPVNSSSAATITDKVVAAEIPLVYINREPDETEEQRWADNNWDVTYVGCDARQSGTFQGEIISDLGLDALDFNGNGKVDYIMVEGDPENVDAQYRTEKSIERLSQDIEVEELTKQRGDWDQTKGQEITANALSQYGDKIDVVFCNNDAMALGALQAIEAAGRTVNKDIYLVGVDALVEVVENVMNDKMTGTVFNDYFGQAHKAADVALDFVNGKDVDNVYMVDYVKVTPENASEILELIK